MENESRGTAVDLSKRRRNDDQDKSHAVSSIDSLSSSSDHGVDTPGMIQEIKAESTGLRASMESAIDKVRTRRRSVDDGRLDRRGSDDSRRLSTLVAKTKRTVKKKLKVVDPDSQRNNLSVNSGSRLSLGELEGNHSDSSLMHNGSGRSSLMTDDERSDPDGDCTRDRPILLPRQSHQGYLTLSSPEINAQTSHVLPNTDAYASTEAFPAVDLPSTHHQVPRIVKPSNTSTTSLPDRTSSPSGKLRSAWTLPRKKSGGGGDTEPLKAVGGGGGGGLGSIFKTSSRRNSVNTQASSDQDTPSILSSKEDITGSNKLRTKREAKPKTPATPKHLPLNTAHPSTPQNLYEPPTTLVTPPTPVTDSHSDLATVAKSFTSPAVRSLNSVDSIRHRRAQSASFPSKLSTSTNGPLTPTIEETKTPGGTLTSPNTATGFFSSVFSVAQKAGAQFSSTIVPAQKNKPPGVIPLGLAETEEVIPGPDGRPGSAPAGGERTQLAVETLGKGSLSLSHLGIEEGQDTATMPSAAELEQHDAQTQSGQAGKNMEEEAAARAVSSAYEKPARSAIGDALDRSMSVASADRLASTGEQTPPRTVLNGSSAGVKRSASVRSKMSGRRKHRSSSATQGTSNSIAAAIINSSSGLANPSMNGLGHRLTGFAVASNKRNKDFHQLFRSVPEDDYLIEDYSAALQRDILLHGRLYVSEGHICFSSNILGWVTNLVISFDEVVSVEKKSTAVIFPNAIVISTLNARNTFASFVARDSTYELLIGIWKISHPNLKSSLNGVQLDEGGTGDRTEVAEADHSDGDTDDASEDEIYDEDDDDDAASFTDGGILASHAGSELGDLSLSRKPSASPMGASSPPTATAARGLESADAVMTGAAVSGEFPGAPTHEPTQCTEPGEHYDRPLTDTTISAPLGKVYSMMFGPASGAFMRKWLVEDQKSRELNYVDDKTGLNNEHTSFTFDYIKPLNAPVGPRQTKCITTNTVKAFDLERSISIDCSTQTPDVPSGNVFTTKTRYCLMWGPGNSTRMIASCTIEWTGKSWLKGPIEKGANDGQIAYVKSIIAALEAAVTAKPPVKGTARKGKRRDKKEIFDADAAVAKREAAIAAVQQSSGWGPFESIRQILDPIFGIIGPLITSQVVIVFLFLLLAYSWFFSSARISAVGSHGYTPERMAAYEAIWQREENALWDWLDDRVGLGDGILPDRQKVMRAKDMGRRVDDDRMAGRQMDEAIRTTEERLQALKDAMQRKAVKKSATA